MGWGVLEIVILILGIGYANGEEERRRDIPRCSVETETSRAAGYDDDLPLEGEDGGEILKLCFCHCGLRLGLELTGCLSARIKGEFYS